MNLQQETHRVTNLTETSRLQDYGVGIFKLAATKSALKKVIKKGFVKVNNLLASTATYITNGDIITLEIPKTEAPKKQFLCKLNILFEDDYLAIIEKPAGLLVSGNTFKTVTNALVQNLKPSIETDRTKPQPVHRLDYGTTGVLLIGKTTASIIALNNLFANKTISKTYLAITIGDMSKTGTINNPIDNKTAISHFTVIDNVISKRFKSLNLLELKLETGRRHQLRKHLSGINNQILGDKDYGKETLKLKGKGIYLHAYQLEFIHPFTKEEISIKTEFPKRFSKIFCQSTS